MSQSNSETTHSDFKQSLSMEASPDAIYDFVADIRNFPKYMPTTKSAESQGEGRVRVQGEAHGHPIGIKLRRVERLFPAHEFAAGEPLAGSPPTRT